MRGKFPDLTQTPTGAFAATLGNLVAAVADPRLSRTWRVHAHARLAVIDVGNKDGVFQLEGVTDASLAVARWSIESLGGFEPVAPELLRAAIDVALLEDRLKIAPRDFAEHAAWLEGSVREAIGA